MHVFETGRQESTRRHAPSMKRKHLDTFASCHQIGGGIRPDRPLLRQRCCRLCRRGVRADRGENGAGVRRAYRSPHPPRALSTAARPRAARGGRGGTLLAAARAPRPVRRGEPTRRSVRSSSRALRSRSTFATSISPLETFWIRDVEHDLTNRQVEHDEGEVECAKGHTELASRDLGLTSRELNLIRRALGPAKGEAECVKRQPLLTTVNADPHATTSKSISRPARPTIRSSILRSASASIGLSRYSSTPKLWKASYL